MVSHLLTPLYVVFYSWFISGNVVGFRYRSVPAKAYDSKGQCMFFPSSVTPSKPCIFPEIPRSYASTETPLRTRRTSGYVGSGSRRSLRHPVQGGPAPSHPYSDSRSRTSSSLSDFLDWYASAATRGISLSDEEDERATVVETQADNESSEDMAGEFHPSWTRVLPPFEQRGDDDISGWNIPSPVYEGHSTRSTSEVGHRAQAHRRWHSNEEEVISEADTMWHWMPNENEIHYPVSWVEAAQTEVGEPTGISSGIDNNNNTVTASSAVVEEHGTSERNQDNSPPLSPRPVLWSHRPLHDMVSEAPPAVDSNPLPHGLSEFDLVQIDVSVLSPDIFGHSPESTNGLPTPTSPSPDPPVVNSSAAVASSAVRSSSTVNTPSEAATTPHSPLQPPSVRTPPIASHPRPPRETPPWFDSSRRDRNRSPAPRGGSAPPAVSRPTFHHAHRPIIPPPPPNFFPFLDAIRLRRPRVISHGEGEIREGRSQSRSWRARHNHVMRSREPNEEERRAPRQSEIAQEVQTDSEPESYDRRQELPWPILREYSGVQYHIEPAILRPDVRRSSSLAPSLDSSNSFIRPSLSPTRRMTMPAFLSGRPETAVANENTTSEDSEDSRDSSWWRRSWHDVRTGLEDKDEEVPPDTRHRHSRHHEEYLMDGSG